ncbi:MAG: RNA pyrophosphohydrolase [Hyphomicrobiaceae bacterium]
MTIETKGYRPNVGIALFNAQGLVLIGRTESSGPEIVEPDHDWQMPQGGIDGTEDIVAAARREVWEETNARSLDLLGTTDDWWHYDFPPYDGPPHKLTPFRGQRQRWVAFRFTGDDSEIDVAHPAGGQPQEFFSWRWERLERTPDLVVSYKRTVYRSVAEVFRPFAAA